MTKLESPTLMVSSRESCLQQKLDCNGVGVALTTKLPCWVAGYDSVLYTRILEKNLSIGTASLFWQCYWYHYYRALGFCELIVLRQNDFRKMRIYKEFPVS